MDDKQVLIDLWRFLEDHGRKPSVALVSRMARDMGARVQNEVAYAVLLPLVAAGESLSLFPGEVGESKSLTNGEVGENPGRVRGEPTRTRADLKGIVKAPVITTQDSIAVSLSGDGRKPIPEWVSDLRLAVTSIAKVTLAELNREQRVVVARYHAFRFENYVKSEAVNNRRALQLVGAIADLARTTRCADVTVTEYVGYLVALQKAAGGAPIRSPWALKGAIEENG